jgi:hypothetical protein
MTTMIAMQLTWCSLTDENEFEKHQGMDREENTPSNY